MGERRKTPRAPILTQVEAQGNTATALGHARDISLGGMLIETPETLAEGATVIVRFFIPPNRKPIQAAGRVVRVRQGKSMGIAFLGLRQADREKIGGYIKKTQAESGVPAAIEVEELGLQQRRSERITRRIPVILSWEDEEGRPRQEAAETLLLSKHGAMVQSFTEMEPGELVRLTVSETGRKAVARVVWVKAAQVGGRAEMGLEILGTEDFWGISFRPHRPETPEEIKAARFGGGQVLRRVPVIVSWTDEYGRAREEQAETRLLSQHGALISCLSAMPLKQHLRLQALELNREAAAQVIWVQSSEIPGRSDVGIEFLDTEDFWGFPFPPAPGSAGT